MTTAGAWSPQPVVILFTKGLEQANLKSGSICTPLDPISQCWIDECLSVLRCSAWMWHNLLQWMSTSDLSSITDDGNMVSRRMNAWTDDRVNPLAIHTSSHHGPIIAALPAIDQYRPLSSGHVHLQICPIHKSPTEGKHNRKAGSLPKLSKWRAILVTGHSYERKRWR